MAESRIPESAVLSPWSVALPETRIHPILALHSDALVIDRNEMDRTFNFAVVGNAGFLFPAEKRGRRCYFSDKIG